MANLGTEVVRPPGGRGYGSGRVSEAVAAAGEAAAAEGVEGKSPCTTQQAPRVTLWEG